METKQRVARPKKPARSGAVTKVGRKRRRRGQRSLMRNLVGRTIPTNAEVKKPDDALHSVDQLIGKFGVRLTPPRRLQLPKPRTGALRFVPLIAQLAGAGRETGRDAARP